MPIAAYDTTGSWWRILLTMKADLKVRLYTAELPTPKEA